MFSFKYISLLIIKCIFLGLFYYPAYASQNHSASEERICIENPLGLSLRKAPRIDAERIGIIPCDEEVIAKGSKGDIQQIECQSGKWVKVEYKGVKGYVFGL